MCAAALPDKAFSIEQRARACGAINWAAAWPSLPAALQDLVRQVCGDVDLEANRWRLASLLTMGMLAPVCPVEPITVLAECESLMESTADSVGQQLAAFLRDLAAHRAM
jgi:hypothetical protein